MQQNANLALQIVNQDGRQFNIRLVRRNGVYGADDSLRHQQSEPLLEFFDASSQDEDNALGYFTGIRCAVSTLFQNAFELGSPADVLFNESLPIWNISSGNISAIQEWLMLHLEQAEKHFLHQPAARARQEPANAEEAELACLALPPEPPVAPEPLPVLETGFRPRLLALIASLDELESQAPHWQEGRIEARLALLAAKRELLLALAAAA